MFKRKTIQDELSADSRKFSAIKKANKTTVVLALLLIVAVAVGGYFTVQYKKVKDNPQAVSQAEQKSLIGKVGQLIDLPKDEQPSIATVSDKAKLKEQAFFSKAENGDTLLIYTNAKKAILYRETTNKIVEVAPIAIDTSSAGTTPTTTPEPTPAPAKKQ
jgi:uncharacterized protein HemX